MGYYPSGESQSVLRKGLYIASIALCVGEPCLPAAPESARDSENKQIRISLERYLHAQPPPATDVIWNEETVPVLEIQSIQHPSRNLRLVQGCLFQPSLLYPGVRFLTILEKTSRGWRPISFESSPEFCRPEVETTPSPQ